MWNERKKEDRHSQDQRGMRGNEHVQRQLDVLCDNGVRIDIARGGHAAGACSSSLHSAARAAVDLRRVAACVIHAFMTGFV